MLRNARKVSHPSQQVYKDSEHLQREYVREVHKMCTEMRMDSNVTNYTMSICEEELASERESAESNMITTEESKQTAAPGKEPISCCGKGQEEGKCANFGCASCVFVLCASCSTSPPLQPRARHSR